MLASKLFTVLTLRISDLTMTRLFVLKTSPKNYSRCYSIRKHLSHHYPTSARALCCCARTWTWQETESSWREIGPEADKADPGPSGTVCAHLRRRTMLLDLKMSCNMLQQSLGIQVPFTARVINRAIPLSQWIGLMENLPETLVFALKYRAFL